MYTIDRARTPNNLPTPLTSFIGRADEIVTLKRLVRTTRLLTLTGAGGCGKTRLMRELASSLAADFSDGIWWIELAPLSDPALVPRAVAAASSITEQPGRPMLDTLSDALNSRRILLVFDNCEHVVAAA